MAESTTYSVTKYAEGQIHAASGVRAGMWAVLRTTTERVAYADTEAQARDLIRMLKVNQDVEGKG